MRLFALVLASLLLVGCTDELFPEEGAYSSSVTTNNRLSSNRLASNRLASNRLASNRLASNRLASNRLAADLSTWGDLLADPEGQELLTYIISCALPEGVTVVATDPVTHNQLEFFGSLNLAPEWADRDLDRAGRGWVSACLLARVNANDTTVSISMRGPNGHLGTTAAERADYSLQEGAFFGDLFNDPSDPLKWYACRGKDQAVGEIGGLADRDCTEPSPTDPTKTICGFNFAGDCADFVAPANVYACKKVVNGYYTECATTSVFPTKVTHGHGHSGGHHGHGHHYGHYKDGGHHDDDDDDDDDDDHGDCRGDKKYFEQVITTYALPNIP
ncbi:MAG: hypothetical protein JWP01_1453 [Myxococcales bacterium]|nr:hypothetical protein [Myxococcales bacterium]